MPCDVAGLVSQKCLSCHGPVPQNAAPMRLVSYADFTAASMIDASATVAQRSVVRMEAGNPVPMPPAYAPQVTDDERALFAAWVNAGAVAGTCRTDPDAGLGYDAGPPVVTCTSGALKPKPSPANPHGGADMAPGWACRACHIGQNFEGQNPGGALGMTVPYDVMGTVYAGFHEQDFCVSTVGDAGYVVEVVDSTGALVISAAVNPTGNFYGSVAMDAGLKVPYAARIVKGAQVRVMVSAQTNGDCNQCHTELGLMDAQGRLIGP